MLRLRTVWDLNILQAAEKTTLEHFLRESKEIQTFSKKEWLQILEQCQVSDYTFYYPYPDYKFPMTIFSDKYLPKKEELNNNYQNFDRDRMILFNDDKVYQSLLENDLFPEFSNSYLIEIRKGEEA